MREEVAGKWAEFRIWGLDDLRLECWLQLCSRVDKSLSSFPCPASVPAEQLNEKMDTEAFRQCWGLCLSIVRFCVVLLLVGLMLLAVHT